MESTLFRMQAGKPLALAMAAVVSTLSLAGCSHSELEARRQARQAELSRGADMQVVDAVRDSGVRAAIVAEHTIYSYHFVTDSDSLNELGERDLAVLAAHYRAHAPGHLNIYRGGAESNLYNARVRQVVQALKTAGIDTDQVQISDSGAGAGSGMSEDVLRDVKRMHDDQILYYTNNSSSSSSSSNGSESQGSSSSSSSSGGQQ